ncbi:MAG: PDR/VanB family oxidoreductase, partial [Janibacter sp.]|nr:PDR/VanB family oxidoreductase [Janibacter sp.]
QPEGCPVPHIPRPEHYEIAVLREDESRGGSAWVHDHLREGEVLTVRGPRNHFHLPEQAQRYVFVAGGIGITPIRAMAAQAAREGTPYEIHYLGRERAGMAFVDELMAEHGDRLVVHCSGEGTRADLRALMSDNAADGRAGRVHVYACGPQRMIDDLTVDTADWPEDTVVFEHFSSTLGELDPEQEHEFTVHLADSDIDVVVTRDRTLLQTLREAGMTIPSNCQEGLCGTCEVPVLDGAIDHRDVVLSASERREGDRMMSCCSRATGERLVLGL